MIQASHLELNWWEGCRLAEKKIDLSLTVYELCKENPETVEILQDLGFNDITKPGMLQTTGRFMTVPKGAQMKHIDLALIKRVFEEHGYEVMKGE
jgi:hypothetical protein